MQESVFSPAFGNRPSRLVGRSRVITSLLEGLQGRAGSKERATMLLGQRGSGKTVLLWELADKARELGYVVAAPTVVSDSMLDRIIEKIQDDGERYVKRKRSKVVGGSVGFLGFSAGLQFDSDTQESKSFGYKLDKLARRIGEQGHGLLILVDELQANSPELRQLIISYQELVGAGQDVALIMAGLPGAVSSVLNDRVLTFLNRASKVQLEPLAVGEVDVYFAQAFEQSHLSISKEMRMEAARATQGSPYLLQLIGYYLVEYAGAGGAVTRERLENALNVANESYEEDVCKTTLAALSGRDVDFLSAMSEDSGPSRISEIASRMSVAEDYAQKYRRRLIDAGVIKVVRRGYVDFDVPLLREYLQSNRI